MKAKAKTQAGFIVTIEMVLVITILSVGLIVGLATLRDAINAELLDFAEAIDNLEQDFVFNGTISGQNIVTVPTATFGTPIIVNPSSRFHYLELDEMEGVEGLAPSSGASSAGNQGGPTVGPAN